MAVFVLNGALRSLPAKRPWRRRAETRLGLLAIGRCRSGRRQGLRSTSIACSICEVTVSAGALLGQRRSVRFRTVPQRGHRRLACISEQARRPPLRRGAGSRGGGSRLNRSGDGAPPSNNGAIGADQSSNGRPSAPVRHGHPFLWAVRLRTPFRRLCAVHNRPAGIITGLVPLLSHEYATNIKR